MRAVMIVGVALLSACASFPPPTDVLAESIASTRGAEEIGAENVPKAALSLQLAREEINKTKKLMAAGENEQAHYMALRATNDAELAIALTREEHAREVAAKAQAQAAAVANEAP